jgi:hypothetical protein|tara:strand:- start:295 stop:612 length:318 start_codon:yes stop_codon:yes gene_type:complete
MELEQSITLSEAVSQYGFPLIMAIGMGYFIYYIWNFVSSVLEPALDEMHIALIRVIDQTRMLDQDMIRLQQKVSVVIEYRKRQEVLDDAKEKEALVESKKHEKIK